MGHAELLFERAMLHRVRTHNEVLRQFGTSGRIQANRRKDSRDSPVRWNLRFKMVAICCVVPRTVDAPAGSWFDRELVVIANALDL